MGRMDFIFEYQEYIEKVLNLSQKDDKHIYDEYRKWHIVEGLIKTHPSNKSSEIISKRFSELNSNVEADGKIYVEGNFRDLEGYIPLFNNLGYFISEVTFDGEKWTKEFNNKSKPIAIFLEPKYDTKIDPLPNVLYHATLDIYIKRIKNYGLMPKSQNKLSQHPERIYLTDNIKLANTFGEYLKNMHKQDYSICEIDTTGLTINLYRDINLPEGYYTLNNISKDFISKII